MRRRVRACRRAAPSQSQVGTTFILRTRNRNPPINPTHSSGFYLIHLPPSKRKSFNWLILLNLASYQTNERWMVGRNYSNYLQKKWHLNIHTGCFASLCVCIYQTGLHPSGDQAQLHPQCGVRLPFSQRRGAEGGRRPPTDRPQLRNVVAF
ncbi:hypothetical protein F2P81_015814 [Scophthalmus maximus]|uniref:Uncharacterized protein n=1 Tax=Scophthalmus maximus TaxID=52904 RepID=A0A6A4SFJ7_SCOMX|nr:hypothetical protein F2P81_015814 [Scophthalmus maximus]